MTKMLLEESSKQALQAALADLLLATASELKERKHPGWAYCVYTKDSQVSSSTLHSLLDDGDISHQGYNQFLVDACLLKKPRQDLHAHSVSDHIWEAFCHTFKIHYCEPKVMNLSNIKAWGAGKKVSAFLRVGGGFRH
jgi:hypothetical protein